MSLRAKYKQIVKMFHFRRKYFAAFIITITFISYVYLYSQHKYLYYKDLLDSRKMVRFPERKMHLDIACYNHHKQSNIDVPQFKHVLRKMLVDTVHNISWCPVYKCGSIVGHKIFAELGGGLNARVLNFLNVSLISWNMVARKAFPRKTNLTETYMDYNKTKSFIIVRHPFDRVLSMYRAAWRTKFLRKNVFFKEEPNFRDFLVTLVTNFSSFDEDWAPIYRQCLPCTFQYNYIIKTEFFVQDTVSMLEQLGLGKFQHLKLKKRDVDYLMIAYYYEAIPRSLLEKLFDLYKEDFIFFDYSPKRYYELSKCLY